ncbi:MAG: polysaccharide deacetylase family protein [Deltaproteobacteria bacterium]|nr:polysaccharide deacetylase family protein [Deltaproteobacteria bacterium]MCB9785540.1 polysaccharide deacetylase family protein [Deltaproteobacteria bacterium]
MSEQAGQALAAVNVDIDSLYLYYRIHGLDEAKATNAVWERGVVRFAELFGELGLRATFFVVAQDLERWPAARRICGELARAGHEIGSHTWSHPYDFTRKGRTAVELELRRAREAIADATGQRAVGFRAPGYTITDLVLEVLAEQGYAYDSSLFPCPPYYLAKAAVLGSMRLRGKQSQSILDHPRVMWQSRLPHRRAGMLELPVTVLPGVRFPFIGTSLLMMGRRGYALARPLMRRLPFVNLEFHGIDLCDLETDGIDAALLQQPDLRVPLADKLVLFRRVLTDLRDGFQVDTLAKLAPRLG